jgi:hypothetical protein
MRVQTGQTAPQQAGKREVLPRIISDALFERTT